MSLKSKTIYTIRDSGCTIGLVFESYEMAVGWVLALIDEKYDGIGEYSSHKSHTPHAMGIAVWHNCGNRIRNAVQASIFINAKTLVYWCDRS